MSNFNLVGKGKKFSCKLDCKANGSAVTVHAAIVKYDNREFTCVFGGNIWADVGTPTDAVVTATLVDSSTKPSPTTTYDSVQVDVRRSGATPCE
jgi:hypothetical protein